ncbi:MAG: ATP-binding protein [Proteocatella sp.]
MSYYINIIGFIVIVLLLKYINHINKYLGQLMTISKKIKENNYNVRLERKFIGKYTLIGDVMVDLARAVQSETMKNSENNSKIEAVLSTVPNGLIAIDIEENVIFINIKAKEIFGIKHDIVGKNLFIGLRNIELENTVKSLIYNYKGPIRYSVSKKHYEFDIENIKDSRDNSVMGKLVNITDLTTVLNIENIRSQFVSNVTHELKTPLTSISGFVETLKNNDNIPKETQYKFLNIIEEETVRLNELIDDVLTLSFIEQNLDINLERINLVKVLEDTIFKLENIAKLKNINLELITEEKNIFIQSNKYSLTMIFINIIDNSIKYSNEGQNIKIEIISKKEKVIVTVTDQGKGIAEDDLPRIFERFYRVDKSRTKKEKGTGLGLAIVKHLTKSIGAEIDLQSKLGEGTKFSVILPVTYEKGE